MRAPSAAEARVYEALVQSGLFEAGGVLVGTHAFLNIGNLLCVRWHSDVARTDDTDVAHDPSIEVAAIHSDIDLKEALRKADRGFLPVPVLNPKHPSTTFKIRGKSLSVSVLTPQHGKPSGGPVFIEGLNLAAEPVRYLDYLLEKSQPAAVPTGSGLLITVPDPARFALHKIVVSQRRPASMAAKSKKDLFQAEALIEVLRALRPGDVVEAADAAQVLGGKFVRRLQTGAALLNNDISDFLLRQLTLESGTSI